MAILLLFLATLLAPTAQAQGSRPNVPDAFTGNGPMIVFGFGTPTVMYFDYAGQRQRFDQQAFGGVQTIVEYHTEGIKWSSKASAHGTKLQASSALTRCRRGLHL
jgi:hypothetical protein